MLIFQLRISGYTAYSWYTYSCNPKHTDEEFADKLKRMVFPKSWGGNAATKHGKRMEPKAKLAYEQKNCVHITETGLIIPADRPWMCYSPDGIIVSQKALVEIKCPVSGQTMTASTAVRTCHFIVFDNNQKPHLRKRHPYYGQVQLGMYLLNLQTCHFLVYASFDHSFVDVEVPYDQSFISDFINVLDQTYFNRILPYLYTNYKSLRYFLL